MQPGCASIIVCLFIAIIIKVVCAQDSILNHSWVNGGIIVIAVYPIGHDAPGSEPGVSVGIIITGNTGTDTSISLVACAISNTIRATFSNFTNSIAANCAAGAVSRARHAVLTCFTHSIWTGTAKRRWLVCLLVTIIIKTIAGL